MNSLISSKLVLAAATIFLLAACQSSNISRDIESAPPSLITKNTSVSNYGLKVATWNVEHLAYPIDTGCKPRSPAELTAMRSYITDVNADIFALQEVASKQAVQNLFPEENWQVFMSPRENSETFSCRKTGNTSTQQKLAFAVRKGLKVNDVQGLSAFSLNRPGLRYALQIEIQTSFGEISLLNVHLKSGCFVDNYSRADSESCKVFSKQAPILDLWVEEKERQNIPYMVLGDFNHRLSAPYNHLTQQLFTNSDASDSSLQNTSADLIGCHPYYPAPIDSVFIGGMANNTISYQTQFHKFENMQVKSMLSDHCALTLKLSKNPGTLSNGVKWQTTSKEYQFLTNVIYKQASNSLKQNALLKDNWIVVLDVDETILDNSLYQVELEKNNLSYTPESWAKWVMRKEATLVPGVKGFVKTVLDLGGKLAFITNRDKHLDSHTWQNLLAKGLPLSFENTCLMGRSPQDKQAIDHANIINDKDLRRQQVKAGKADCYHTKGNKQAALVWDNAHKIVMEVGDNIEDFSGVTQEYANIAELLQNWPNRLILLPNPMYGSW